MKPSRVPNLPKTPSSRVMWCLDIMNSRRVPARRQCYRVVFLAALASRVFTVGLMVISDWALPDHVSADAKVFDTSSDLGLLKAFTRCLVRKDVHIATTVGVVV